VKAAEGKWFFFFNEILCRKAEVKNVLNKSCEM
jgi:hypothetical protein